MITTIPRWELWFIDIKKYIFDSLNLYVPLIQKIWTNNVHIWKKNNISKIQPPFVALTRIWWSTDSLWLRNEMFQIDVISETAEEAEVIKDIVVDLFNRRNFKWVRSKLALIWPDMSRPKISRYRQILRFDFYFKDMAY